MNQFDDEIAARQNRRVMESLHESPVPEGPTRAYLMVIDREPKAVQKALRIA